MSIGIVKTITRTSKWKSYVFWVAELYLEIRHRVVFFAFLANQGKCGHEQKGLLEWGHNGRKHRLFRDDLSNKTKIKIYTKNEDSYTGVFEPYLREIYWQLMESNNGLKAPK